MNRPPVDYIERTRAQYDGLGYPPYSWVNNPEPPPFTPLGKPVRESRIALIASGGVYRTGQVAFHFRDDFSYRIIEADTPNSELRATHFAYDLRGARSDPNCVFPLETLRKLAAGGEVGSISPRAFTFMGGIYSARKVSEVLAPALAEELQRDEVDLALLVPV